jgi:hypothetical protein
MKEKHLTDRARVSLAIYDIRGRRVATVVDGELAEGRHVATWRSENVPAAAGVYFAHLSVGARELTQRFVLLR